VKAVWWNVKKVKKRLKKRIVPREAVRKANPIVPQPIIHAVWTSLKRLRASDIRPRVLAQAAPMTPAGGADEDGARAPVSRPSGRGGGQCTNARLRARSARRAVSGMARTAGSIRPAARDAE
jgi:hypothetical protein